MGFLETAAGVDPVLVEVYIGFMRWIAPALVLLILLRCCLPLLSFRREPEIWAWLYMEDGDKYAITHWENVIGRNEKCDVVVDFPTASRNHAVLTRYDDGSWTVCDADSKSGTMVNGERGEIFAIQEDDVISVGGVDLIFAPIMLLVGVALFLLRATGMSAHIALSAVGLAVLIAYTVLTRKSWKLPALEVLLRVCYGLALITGGVLMKVHEIGRACCR
jgi:hypothetical protein